MLPKSITLLVFLGICSSIVQASDHIKSNSSEDVEFVIVIPSYKNEKWAEDNLKSACHQKTSLPYQVFYINDCSPDRTGEIVDDYIKKHNLESFVTVIHNKENLGALANIYNTIHRYVPDNKVVVLLDGDDMLSHDEVLLTLEKHYRDPYIWMTYGSAKRNDTGK